MKNSYIMDIENIYVNIILMYKHTIYLQRTLCIERYRTIYYI